MEKKVNNNGNRQQIFSMSRLFELTNDEVAVWNRALTSAEVSQMYNSGTGTAYPYFSDSTPLITYSYSTSTFANPDAVTSIVNGTATGCEVMINLNKH